MDAKLNSIDIVTGQFAWAKDDLGMDDETYRFLVWECDAEPTQLMACFNGLGLDRKDRISERTKRKLREFAHELLEQEITLQKRPIKATANNLARRAFAIERVEWLRMDQIGELIWLLRKKRVVL